MRFVHTADWHLGRKLHEASLLDDQTHALDQVARACKEERADALIVAGDIFDRAVPPEDAVRLLSDFLSRMARDVRIPVVAISGNHDSAGRLGFGADLLGGSGVHLLTTLAHRATPVLVKDVAIFALPFLEPEAARAELGDPGIDSHRAAVRAALADVRTARSRHKEAVLVAHLYAGGGRPSPDSERPLFVGGAGDVPASDLLGFTYVALGHLHEPQEVAPGVRYSGSLLKYSFGEAAHVKGLTLVEVIGGRALSRQIPIEPLHDVVRIEGRFEDLLRSPRFAAAERAYVEARFTDPGYVFDAASRLRERFALLLSVVPVALEEPALPITAPLPLDDHRALFEAFLAHVGAGPPDPQRVAVFEQALREAASDPAEAS